MQLSLNVQGLDQTSSFQVGQMNKLMKGKTEATDTLNVYRNKLVYK